MYHSRESSFCVSLGSESSTVKAFSPNLWPIGVIVRPFRPARKNSYRRHGNRSFTAGRYGQHQNYPRDNQRHRDYTGSSNSDGRYGNYTHRRNQHRWENSSDDHLLVNNADYQSRSQYGYETERNDYVYYDY